jgi:MOSC domain-containing protein YiiM
MRAGEKQQITLADQKTSDAHSHIGEFVSLNPAPSGQVVSLQICPAHRAPMQAQNPVRAVENLGLENDRHAMPDGKRQVLLMSEEILKRLDVPIGAVKENITTRGIELMRLKPGTRLQIGSAVFELTKACEPCSRMDEIRMGLREELEGQRGMLARVLQTGEIHIGDEIFVLG